jgi:hypothetical protein
MSSLADIKSVSKRSRTIRKITDMAYWSELPGDLARS